MKKYILEYLKMIKSMALVFCFLKKNCLRESLFKTKNLKEYKKLSKESMLEHIYKV